MKRRVGETSSNRANAVHIFSGNFTTCTVSGVGRLQFSAGEVTRYSRHALGRSA
jgi:hypothetical protein